MHITFFNRPEPEAYDPKDQDKAARRESGGALLAVQVALGVIILFISLAM